MVTAPRAAAALSSESDAQAASKDDAPTERTPARSPAPDTAADAEATEAAAEAKRERRRLRKLKKERKALREAARLAAEAGGGAAGGDLGAAGSGGGLAPVASAAGQSLGKGLGALPSVGELQAQMNKRRAEAEVAFKKNQAALAQQRETEKQMAEAAGVAPEVKPKLFSKAPPRKLPPSNC